MNIIGRWGYLIRSHRSTSGLLLIVLTVSIFLAACQAVPESIPPAGEDPLQVIVTTTFLGDIVGRIAGDKVDLKILLAPGQNPHSFQISPRDLVSLTDAELLIVNGFGLEEFLDELLAGSNYSGRLVVASEGITPYISTEIEGEIDPDHSGADPHVWLNPINIKIWVDNISETLTNMDPLNKDYYQDQAGIYIQEIENLDKWIRNELAAIPVENRELVSDHGSLGYFAREYGLQEIGAVIPGLTTEAETSGQQLAELIDSIRYYQVKAVFVGEDFNPSLAERVTEETGTALVVLYLGSLSDGPPADTYLNFMRYNVETLVDALK